MMSKEVDPQSIRTIGVVTKLDLAEKGIRRKLENGRSSSNSGSTLARVSPFDDRFSTVERNLGATHLAFLSLFLFVSFFSSSQA